MVSAQWCLTKRVVALEGHSWRLMHRCWVELCAPSTGAIILASTYSEMERMSVGEKIAPSAPMLPFHCRIFLHMAASLIHSIKLPCENAQPRELAVHSRVHCIAGRRGFVCVIHFPSKPSADYALCVVAIWSIFVPRGGMCMYKRIHMPTWGTLLFQQCNAPLVVGTCSECVWWHRKRARVILFVKLYCASVPKSCGYQEISMGTTSRRARQDCHRHCTYARTLWTWIGWANQVHTPLLCAPTL